MVGNANKSDFCFFNVFDDLRSNKLDALLPHSSIRQSWLPICCHSMQRRKGEYFLVPAAVLTFQDGWFVCICCVKKKLKGDFRWNTKTGRMIPCIQPLLDWLFSTSIEHTNFLFIDTWRAVGAYHQGLPALLLYILQVIWHRSCVTLQPSDSFVWMVPSTHACLPCLQPSSTAGCSSNKPAKCDKARFIFSTDWQKHLTTSNYNQGTKGQSMQLFHDNGSSPPKNESEACKSTVQAPNVETAWNCCLFFFFVTFALEKHLNVRHPYNSMLNQLPPLTNGITTSSNQLGIDRTTMARHVQFGTADADHGSEGAVGWLKWLKG